MGRLSQFFFFPMIETKTSTLDWGAPTSTELSKEERPHWREENYFAVTFYNWGAAITYAGSQAWIMIHVVVRATKLPHTYPGLSSSFQARIWGSHLPMYLHLWQTKYYRYSRSLMISGLYFFSSQRLTRHSRAESLSFTDHDVHFFFSLPGTQEIELVLCFPQWIP